jgi:hypothetical protein
LSVSGVDIALQCVPGTAGTPHQALKPTGPVYGGSSGVVRSGGPGAMTRTSWPTAVVPVRMSAAAELGRSMGEGMPWSNRNLMPA